MQRAGQLCDPHTLAEPSPDSPYRYWPNRRIETGPHDGDTFITYEDNLPIQHQQDRLGHTIRDLRIALGKVVMGIDGTEVSIAMRDIVAVLRRIIELEGFDAQQLRPTKTDALLIKKAIAPVDPLAEYDGPGAEVIALIRKAVEIDPDLTDDLGNPIAPLLTRHVPRLMEVYRQALTTTTSDQHADIDKDLLEGLELVRQATEQGLAQHSDKQRCQLRAEIAFLRTRGAQNKALTID